MQVTVNIEIAAPAADVFAYVADLTNNPNWQSGIESTQWTSPPPLALGATAKQQLDGGKAAVEYRVTALEPGRSITVETLAGAAIPVTVTRTVQMLNESSTRLRMDLVGHPPGWRRLTTPLLRRLVRRDIASDYRRLKRILEHEATDGARAD